AARGRHAHTGARGCPAPPRARVLELVDHRSPQTTREGADGKSFEHVVEEPEDDQSLGLLGSYAARLEVVELLVVDRSDGRRVRATDVVRLDLEVRDRLGAGALGEHEISVGLRCVGLLRGGTQVDETRVDRTRFV